MLDVQIMMNKLNVIFKKKPTTMIEKEKRSYSKPVKDPKKITFRSDIIYFCSNLNAKGTANSYEKARLTLK